MHNLTKHSIAMCAKHLWANIFVHSNSEQSCLAYLPLTRLQYWTVSTSFMCPQTLKKYRKKDTN